MPDRPEPERADGNEGGRAPTYAAVPGAAARVLEEAFWRAVGAADPAASLPDRLPPPPRGRLVVLGAGKASLAMGAAALRHYARSVPTCRRASLLIAPSEQQGSALLPELGELGATVRFATHPVPGAEGEEATRELMALAASVREGDLLLVLISGGGSALLTAPLGVTGAQKAELTRRLLASGADIVEMNTVRKHLSAVKGGRLAVLAGVSPVTFSVSDVVGDDPATIASGPTVADPSTFADATEVVRRYAPDEAEVLAALELGASTPGAETPKPGDARLEGSSYEVVASPAVSVRAVEEYLAGLGFEVLSLGAAVTGEARTVAAAHARIVWERAALGAVPFALVSGGELTVTMDGDPARWGRGGPNGEYAVEFALEFGRLREVRGGRASPEAGGGSRAAGGASVPRVALLAADTDGVDGSGAAGGLLGPAAFERLASMSAGELAGWPLLHDSHGVLAEVGGLFDPGATGSNVNDLRVALLFG